jgi:hypothetical protein
MMILGLPWHLYVIAGICVIVWKLSQQINGRTREPLPEIPTKPELHPVKLFDGPLDGKADMVPEEFIRNVYVIPYIPDDETERIQIGEIHGTKLYAAKFAIYQQAMDENYVYRRDLTEEEYQKLNTTGALPPEFGA